MNFLKYFFVHGIYVFFIMLIPDFLFLAVRKNLTSSILTLIVFLLSLYFALIAQHLMYAKMKEYHGDIIEYKFLNYCFKATFQIILPFFAMLLLLFCIHITLISAVSLLGEPIKATKLEFREIVKHIRPIITEEESFALQANAGMHINNKVIIAMNALLNVTFYPFGFTLLYLYLVYLPVLLLANYHRGKDIHIFYWYYKFMKTNYPKIAITLVLYVLSWELVFKFLHFSVIKYSWIFLHSFILCFIYFYLISKTLVNSPTENKVDNSRKIIL